MDWCFSLPAAVSWYRADWSGRGDGDLLLLPGGKELADNGILQEPSSPG